LRPIFSPKFKINTADWFHVKARFLQQMDNGLVKQVKTELLIDAVSFGEAEEKVFESLDGFRDIVVDGVAKSKIAELVEVGDSDLRFKCTVKYVLADEEGGKEKNVTTYILVEADDAQEAYERCCLHLKEMLVPFTIPKVEETQISEIIHHTAVKMPKSEPNADRLIESKIGKSPAITALEHGIYRPAIIQEVANPANGQPVEFEIEDSIKYPHGIGVDFDVKSWIDSLSSDQHGLLLHNFSTMFLGGDSDGFAKYLNDFGIYDIEYTAVVRHLTSDESEISCEIETDFVEATVIRPPVDPTQGQAIEGDWHDESDDDQGTDLEERLEAAFYNSNRQPQ